MIGLGVPLGAHSACQAESSNPFTPNSSSVGTSFKVARRCGVVTAYTLIFPAWMWLFVLVTWSHMMSIWPPSRSFIAGPVPLYGTEVNSVSIAFMSSSPHK